MKYGGLSGVSLPMRSCESPDGDSFWSDLSSATQMFPALSADRWAGKRKAPGVYSVPALVPATQAEEHLLTPAPPTFLPYISTKLRSRSNFWIRWFDMSAT